MGRLTKRKKSRSKLKLKKRDSIIKGLSVILTLVSREGSIENYGPDPQENTEAPLELPISENSLTILSPTPTHAAKKNSCWKFLTHKTLGGKERQGLHLSNLLSLGMSTTQPKSC